MSPMKPTGPASPTDPARPTDPTRTTADAYVLDVRGLRITLPGTARPVLDGVDLTVAPGETVALVGESGSGKTLTSRAALRLLPPGATAEGSVRVAGRDVLAMGADDLGALRTRTAAMVFQDPRAAVNPLRRIGDFLTESVRLARTASLSRPGRPPVPSNSWKPWAWTPRPSRSTPARSPAECSSGS